MSNTRQFSQEAVIPRAKQIAAAAEYGAERRTLGQKWGWKLSNNFRELAREVFSALEGSKNGA